MLGFFEHRIRKNLEQIETNRAVLDSINDVTYAINIVQKDVHHSLKSRTEGDKLFAQDNTEVEHQHKIIRLYNESIAYAPLESEDLAKTYANKSALLRRMRRYAECITEADKALRITTSIPLKIKLLCRKADCHTALGSPDNRDCLEKAKFFMAKFEVTEELKKMKKMLEKLIRTTQKIIDDEKCEILKTAMILETTTLIAEAQEENVEQKCVEVTGCNKYGLHFVAMRDFQPGEIIRLEKPYHSYIQHNRIFQYCYHCKNYLWTAVSCDHCNWRLYCSEKCKNDSWNRYHDLECLVTSCLKRRMVSDSSVNFFILSIFLKTLKEAGNIRKLLDDIESLGTKGQCIDDFSSELGGLTYCTIYFETEPINLIREKLQKFSEDVIIMLVCLAKLTEIFDIPHDFHSLKKLGNDDTVVSAGALLLKLSFLVTAKSIGFKLIDPTDLDATLHDDSYMHTNENNSNSLALNSSTLMAVKGCIPNIKIDYTRELMCVWHSLQPIKKGDKFIYLDMSSTIYNYIPKSIRQSVSRLFYNCACDCQACTEDWSMFDLEMGMEAVVSKNQSMVIQMKNECDFLTAEKKCNPQKYINPDMKALSTAKDLIVRAWEHCDMPSAIITRAVRIFTETSGDFYGGSRLGSK